MKLALLAVLMVVDALVIPAAVLLFARAQMLFGAIDVEDPVSAATALLEAITKGDAALGVPVGLVILVHALRWAGGKFEGKWPKLDAVLNNPVVLWAMPTLLSAAGAVITSVTAGAPVTLALILKAVMIGLSANGLFNGAKKIDEARGAAAIEAAKIVNRELALKAMADAIDKGQPTPAPTPNERKGPNP